MLIGNENKDKINELIKNNSSLMIVLLISVFTNIILIIGYINIERTVKVEMPPKVISDNNPGIEFDVNNNSATSDYYKTWGYFFISETANFKSKEIQNKMRLITKAYDPQKLKLERQQLDKNGKSYITSDFEELNDFVKNIKKEKVSQKFVVKKVHNPDMAYGNKEASLKIEGIAEQEFEISKSDPINKDEICEYNIALKREEGNLYVTGYQTNCFK